MNHKLVIYKKNTNVPVASQMLQFYQMCFAVSYSKGEGSARGSHHELPQIDNLRNDHLQCS